MQGNCQAEMAPGMDRLYIGSISGFNNKIEVTGSCFLRGVADNVFCNWEYMGRQ